MFQSTTVTAALTILLLGVTANAADPICGDMNDSGGVNTTDALLVLKKGVGQNLTLPCAGYKGVIASCQGDLSECQNAPVCGNAAIEDGEDCDTGDLSGKTCVTEGYGGGTLRCAPGCTIDTQDCFARRFDTFGPIIYDRKTGLEWEKKTTTAGSGINAADPHDVDNTYSWCVGPYLQNCTNPKNPFNGSAATDFLASLNGASTGVCYAGHCDWRLPTFEELASVLSRKSL